MNNKEKEVWDTFGFVVRGSEDAIMRLINYIQTSEGLFLVFHKKSKNKIVMKEVPFGAGKDEP